MYRGPPGFFCPKKTGVGFSLNYTIGFSTYRKILALLCEKCADFGLNSAKNASSIANGKITMLYLHYRKGNGRKAMGCIRYQSHVDIGRHFAARGIPGER